MKRITLTIALSVFVFAISAQELSRQVKQFVDYPAGTISLTNATVIDGTGSDPMENMTIVLKDKHIVAMGKTGDINIPDNTSIIDCSGKTVIPGLIMLHEHLFYTMPFEGRFSVNQMTFTFPRLYLAGGVTTMRTAAGIETQSDINIRNIINAGQFTGPKIDVTGPFIERPGMNIPELTYINSSKEAAQIVDLWANLGATSFKVYMNVTREDLKAVVNAAHSYNHKVTGHLCSVTYREAADIGIDNLEHGFMTSTDFIKDKKPDQCNSRMIRRSLAALDKDSPEMEELINYLVKKDVALTSTLNVFEPYTGREIIPGGGLDALAPQVRERILRAFPSRLYRDSSSIALFKKEMYWEKKFYDAGGLLVAGTDPTGSGRIVAGYSNQRTLELLFEAGFTVPEVVNIVTLNGALYLEIDNITGTIQIGKLADLLIIDGNLSEDISNIRKLEYVFKEGTGYNSERLFRSVDGKVGLN